MDVVNASFLTNSEAHNFQTIKTEIRLKKTALIFFHTTIILQDGVLFRPRKIKNLDHTHLMCWRFLNLIESFEWLICRFQSMLKSDNPSEEYSHCSVTGVFFHSTPSKSMFLRETKKKQIIVPRASFSSSDSGIPNSSKHW